MSPRASCWRRPRKSARNRLYVTVEGANMAKIVKRHLATSLSESGYVVVDWHKTTGGQEVWLVASGGKVHNLTTSTSSTAAMDDAVRIFSSALERLAKR